MVATSNVERPKRSVVWVKNSKKDLVAFPADVCTSVGHFLHEVQSGITPACAKPLVGDKELAGVMEIVIDSEGDTFRAVYTVKLGDKLYVLHCFMKKSKSGSKTPQREIDLIKSRLKNAKESYAEESKKNPKS